MTKQELAEIKARCEVMQHEIEEANNFMGGDYSVDGAGEYWAKEFRKNDNILSSFAEVAGHSIEDVPALLAEVERLQAENDRINDFEQSQCTKLLEENATLKSEISQLRACLSDGTKNLERHNLFLQQVIEKVQEMKTENSALKRLLFEN